MKNNEVKEISNILGIDEKNVFDYSAENNTYIIGLNFKESINGDFIKLSSLAQTELEKLNKYNLIFNKCEVEYMNVVSHIELKNISFYNCRIKNIIFKDAIFTGDILFDGCVVENMKFEYGVFTGKFSINNYYGKSLINSIYFIGCHFKKDFFIKADKINSISTDDLIFDKKTIFDNELTIKAREIIYDIKLKGIAVQGKVNLSCVKFKNLDLSHSIFNDDVDFSYCEFGVNNLQCKLDLSSIIFKKNAKFDEAKFNSFVAFHTSSFKATASFYRVKFDVIPNLAQLIFKEF